MKTVITNDKHDRQKVEIKSMDYWWYYRKTRVNGTEVIIKHKWK